MTQPEIRARLRAKHVRNPGWYMGHPGDCRVCGEPFPCDVITWLDATEGETQMTRASLDALIEFARVRADGDCDWDFIYDALQVLAARGVSSASTPAHYPLREIVLASNPPQHYCVDENGIRNTSCCSHSCDWEGWTEPDVRNVADVSRPTGSASQNSALDNQ